MSFDGRAVAYPLEAVRRRENWRLDALQAELAQAVQKLEQASQAQASLQQEYRARAADAQPAAATVIEPTVAAGQLAYLQWMLTRQRETEGKIGKLADERAKLQARHEQQRTRVESVERHHAAFRRQVASNGERLARAEADRDWVARLQWQARSPGSQTP